MPINTHIVQLLLLLYTETKPKSRLKPKPNKILLNDSRKHRIWLQKYITLNLVINYYKILTFKKLFEIDF